MTAPFNVFDLFKPIPHPALPISKAAAPIVLPGTPAPKLPVAKPAGGTPPSAPLPDEALTFVETEEDGAPAYYVAHYEHWDWPGGISGATAGVGYDFGQVTREEAISDWTGIVDDATLAKMLTAIGLKGSAAQEYVRAHKSEITVTWDQGTKEFSLREVPKWLIRCRAALPNFDALPGLCQGSLFSLAYNRGVGGFYDDIHPRYREMYAIKEDMRMKNFAAIPAQIEAMQRLWPNVEDLRRRRVHEAALFRKGLQPPAS
jgi:hypothetical protein